MAYQGPSPALFFDTISAYQRTEALRAAIELDLFSHVAAGRQTTTELAEACQAAPRGIRILSDSLAILGFLHKDGDRYQLTADAKVFLDRASPAYIGGAARFLFAPELRESFHQLTAAVRRGGTAVSDEGTVSHDNPIWVEFARAMAPLMQMPAQLLAGLVGGDTGQPLRVLDVAAGHGLFGITIAERYRRSHVTALDWPNVLAVAAENARRGDVAERYAVLPGSAFAVDWGGPYDLVLLTNFLHHFDLPTCAQLAAKAYAALRSRSDAGFYSRARPHYSPLDGHFRTGDACHHGSGRRLHVRGIPGHLRPGRVSAQRIPPAAADDATGGGVVQGLNGMTHPEGTSDESESTTERESR